MFREKATNGKKLRVFPTQDGQPSRLRPACSSKPDGFTSWPRVVGLPHGGPRAAAWWVGEARGRPGPRRPRPPCSPVHYCFTSPCRADRPAPESGCARVGPQTRVRPAPG